MFEDRKQKMLGCRGHGIFEVEYLCRVPTLFIITCTCAFTQYTSVICQVNTLRWSSRILNCSHSAVIYICLYIQNWNQEKLRPRF